MQKTKFKIIFLVGLLIVLSNPVAGQIYKLRASALAWKIKLNDYTWSEWSHWIQTSVLVVIDVDNDRIKIYSKDRQVYDVIENEGESIDLDGDKTLSFYCINEDGLTCSIRLVKLCSKKEDFNSMLISVK